VQRIPLISKELSLPRGSSDVADCPPLSRILFGFNHENKANEDLRNVLIGTLSLWKVYRRGDTGHEDY
jgi:hypothetical protein